VLSALSILINVALETEARRRAFTRTENKMKTNRILVMVLLLLAASSTFAQTSRATNAAANRSWQSFWRQVTAAINKKDRVALRKMMPNNFDDGGGGLTPSEWLKYIDENERNGSWRDLQKSFAQGTVVNRNWPAKGIPTRVTKDNRYFFEFRKDKRWYFAGVVGD
jgi:hypothetical protein